MLEGLLDELAGRVEVGEAGLELLLLLGERGLLGGLPGGDLAEDTPDDAGGGSAPPPGAGGCAPPPAEGEESVLERLQRAAREAKDGLPVYTQDTIEEAAGGALRPAPPELMQEMRRHRVIFCSVCFGRGWQVRRALPATLLRLWPYTQDQQYAP